MSLDTKKGESIPAREPPPAWGQLAPAGQAAAALRLTLQDRAVSFPWSELRRWELETGSPEKLKIHAGRELVTIEGTQLAVIAAALDAGRLIEVRLTYRRQSARPEPQVLRIAIESL